MIKLYDEKTQSDVSELWWKEKPKKSKTKNPPMPANHKKTIYISTNGLYIYKGNKHIDTLEFSAVFDGNCKSQPDGITLVGGHGIRTELVAEVQNDANVRKWYEAAKYKRELILAQADLYQPSPFEWNEE